MGSKIKIVIADDHPIFREGLHRVISSSQDLQVVAEATSCAELLEQTKTIQADIVLLDVTMNKELSLDFMKMIKEEKPNLPFLVLSVYPEEYFAMRYIRAGASGYVHKERPLQELVDAIRKVASGGKHLSPEFMEKMAFAPLGSQTFEHESLTDREFQIFRMLAAGESLTKIGDNLFLSVKTVSSHRTNILRKMKMKNNSDLTKYALLNNLI